jgi:hypothetical protein
MRKVLTLLAAGAFVLGSSAAHAVPFTNTLTLTVSGFPPVSFTGSGEGTSVGGGTASIPAESIIAGFVTRLNEPLLATLFGFAVCEQNLAVVPSPTPADFPIPATAGEQVPSCDPLGDGALDAVTYDGVDEGTGGLLATAYLTNLSDNALVAIPLQLIGVGGVQNFSVLGTPATLTANPWTTGFVTVTGGLASGDPTTFEDTGFDNRDGSGEGELKLVTTALTNLGALGTVPAIASLNIVYGAPEPGSTVVGLAAFAALGLLSRRARRS